MDWIGDIPQGWTKRPLWTLFTVRNNKNAEGKEQNLLSLSYGKIIRKDIDTKTGLLPESFNGYNIVEKGDIVLRLTDLQNDMRSLRTGLVREKGIITSAYITLCPKENLDSRYYHYLLHSYDIIKGFYNMGEGIRQNLNFDELSSLVLTLPPLHKQSHIASFLDKRCETIDAAIVKHKAVIEKLDEYRKAVIEKTVINGLLETTMVPCSSSWIELIPDGWQCVPLKSRFRFGKGLSITKENLVESGLPVISYGQIHAKYNTGTSISDELIRLIDSKDADDTCLVKKNDFIFADTSEDLEGCGNCAFVDTDYPIYGGYHTIILKSITDSDNKYFSYLFRTDIWRRQIRTLLTDVKLFSISQKVLKNTTILVPPVNEQAKIVAYLDKKCESIDAAKTKHQELIVKLEEYKKSLIYNAVTGKIEC